ncbi:hypothetical protein E4U46_004178, partial [Claviceps purpurea]
TAAKQGPGPGAQRRAAGKDLVSLIVSSEWRQLSCRRYSEPIEISLGKDADGIAAASAVMMASRLQALDSP